MENIDRQGKVLGVASPGTLSTCPSGAAHGAISGRRCGRAWATAKAAAVITLPKYSTGLAALSCAAEQAGSVHGEICTVDIGERSCIAPGPRSCRRNDDGCAA